MSILVATDLSAGAAAAQRAAAAHARATDSRLSVLHCLEAAAEGVALKDFVADSERVLAGARREAMERVEDSFFEAVPAAERPERIDFRVDVKFAGVGILDVLDKEAFDLVVLGPTGAGSLTGMLFGSTAEEVVRASPVPVMVVPSQAEPGPIAEIVAPVDLSECSRASLEMAVELARTHGARLDIMHHYVVPHAGLLRLDAEPTQARLDEVEHKRRQQLEAFVEPVDLSGVGWELTLWHSSVANTSAAQSIVKRARDDAADLIVVGTHGRRGVKRLFLGSTAFKVLRLAPCPVLVVRQRRALQA